MTSVSSLKPWEVVSFPWGSALRHSKGDWENVMLSPDGQEIDVSKLNIILHSNGIEILGVKENTEPNAIIELGTGEKGVE